MIAALICTFLSFYFAFVLLFKKSEPLVLAQQQRQSRQWQNQLHSLFLFYNSQLLVFGYWLGFVLLPLLCWTLTSSILLALLCLAPWSIAPPKIFARLQRRRLQLFEQQLPDCIDQIASSLRSGSSLINAIELFAQNTSSSVSQEFTMLLREYRLGHSIDQVLASLDKRCSATGMSAFVTTARISVKTGGNVAINFDRLSQSLRQKFLLEQKIKALTAQGKMQGLVVGLLPLAMLAILWHLEPAAMRYIVSSWLGYATLIVLAGMLFLGFWFIRKIVDIEV